MKRSLCPLGMGLILLFLFACHSQESSTTQYQTSYTLSLDSLPPQVPVDSGWVRLYVEGELIQTLYWSEADKNNRELIFRVTTENDQVVRVEYVVYYQGIAVVQGEDIYHPDSPEKSSSGILQRDTEAIAQIMDQLRPSSTALSSYASSSSSETLSQLLTVSFTHSESVVLEGNAVTISLVLDGPEGASLTQNQGVQLLINGAQPSDYSTLNEVSLPAGMKVGQTKSFLFTATGNDQWVEGSETVTLTLGDAGAISFGNDSIHTVTIQDADQATVTFTSSGDDYSEDHGALTVTARLNTAPATAVLALGVGVRGVVDEVYGDFNYGADQVLASFAQGAGDGASASLAFHLEANELWNQLESRYLKVRLQVESGPATLGNLAVYHMNVLESDYEYYITTDGYSSGGYIHILRPLGSTGIEFVKTVSFPGTPFKQLTALPDGRLLALRDGKGWLLDLEPSVPTITQWTMHTDIADLEYGSGEGSVWVVTHSGYLYSYDGAGNALSTVFPGAGALPQTEGIQVTAFSGAKGGAVMVTSTSYDMACTDVQGSALYLSTTYNALPNPSESYWSYNKMVGIPKGIVREPSTNQIYALMDGGCEETCAGLFRAYSGSGPVKVGAALNLKDAANMALTPYGNFLIVAGGAGCALEYGRIIEYNPIEDQLVREYYIDNATQIRKWGGVTVLRNHVNWSP